MSANRNSSGALSLLLSINVRFVTIWKENTDCPSICKTPHQVSHKTHCKLYQYLSNRHTIDRNWYVVNRSDYKFRRSARTAQKTQSVPRITIQATYVYRNNVACSCNNCGSGKAIILHILSVYVSVALVIQHAMRMRHITICDLPRFTTFFHIIS